jgi:hypothetical protein
VLWIVVSLLNFQVVDGVGLLVGVDVGLLVGVGVGLSVDGGGVGFLVTVDDTQFFLVGSLP